MSHPPAAVLRAFGAARQPVLLDGGQRRTWRTGDIVLKPIDDPIEQHTWLCDVYDAWPARDAVRVPEPLRSEDGTWAVRGWAAHRWLEGETVRAAEDPAAFRRTVDGFHDVVAQIARPAFLDRRDDPWSFGDRVAWEGVQPVGPPETVRLVTEAVAALEPLALPAQVIHGDIGGNVLRAPGLPDAVIDWPPYYRPRGFALAVAVWDAACAEEASESLFDAWSDVPGWDQLLVRAAVYRMATDGRRQARGRRPSGVDDSVRRAVELVLRRLPPAGGAPLPRLRARLRHDPPLARRPRHLGGGMGAAGAHASARTGWWSSAPALGWVLRATGGD